MRSTKKYNDGYKRTPGYLAKQEIFKAVRAGRLPKVKSLACIDCGNQAQCYDHREYAKPLDVQAVCISCNKRRGPAKDALIKGQI
jgi:hypothetical protein